MPFGGARGLGQRARKFEEVLGGRDEIECECGFVAGLPLQGNAEEVAGLKNLGRIVVALQNAAVAEGDGR